MTPAQTIRQLEWLRHSVADETPADALFAGDQALSLQALDVAIAVLRSASVTPETRRHRRTLADYRPQHDDDCRVRMCDKCGWWRENDNHDPHRRDSHSFVAEPCTCGLDALVGLSPVSEATATKEMQENKEDGASLLPVDPPASPATTEALPNSDEADGTSYHPFGYGEFDSASGAEREMQHPPRPDCQAEGWHACVPLKAAIGRIERMRARGSYPEAQAVNQTIDLVVEILEDAKCDEPAKPEVGPMQDAESLSGVQALGSSGLATTDRLRVALATFRSRKPEPTLTSYSAHAVNGLIEAIEKALEP